jgi:hypothetical protein
MAVANVLSFVPACPYSVKDRIAYSMITAAEEQGLIKPGKTLLVSGAGFAGACKGHICMHACVPQLHIPATAVAAWVFCFASARSVESFLLPGV